MLKSVADEPDLKKLREDTLATYVSSSTFYQNHIGGLQRMLDVLVRKRETDNETHSNKIQRIEIALGIAIDKLAALQTYIRTLEAETGSDIETVWTTVIMRDD